MTTSTTDTAAPILESDGWAIAPNLDAPGDGGFRRVRQQLGVTAFGMNVKVLEPADELAPRQHLHTEQQEIYFVHEGAVDVVFGDDEPIRVGTGGIVVVNAGQAHMVRRAGEGRAVVVAMGGKDGVVENDGDMLDPA